MQEKYIFLQIEHNGSTFPSISLCISVGGGEYYKHFPEGHPDG